MKKEPNDYKTKRIDRVSMYVEARENGTLSEFY